jgi:hypothetical protein
LSTKLLSILALAAAIGFTLLIILQALELSHYKDTAPVPAAVAAAPAEPAPAASPEAQ